MVKNHQNYNIVSRENEWDCETWAWQKWQDKSMELMEGVDKADETETIIQVAER